MSERKPFKALLLDERDVFIGLVEIDDEADLTERHIDLRPHGGDCDRPVGEYRWNRERLTLEPLPRHQRAKAGRPTLEMAVAFDYLDRWDRSRLALALMSEQPGRRRSDPLPEVTLAWLDDMVRSMDFAMFADLPVVSEYAAERGLDLKKKD